jgi:lysophospholipase L1-like esterase
MKSFLLNLLLLAGGIAVALVLLEIGVRLALAHPQVIDISADGSKSTPETAQDGKSGTIELEKRVDEPEGIYLRTPTGRRLRPNTRAVINNHYLCKCTTEIRTNSLGYRNPEIGEKTKTRVLFLGDSITLADYVREEETWVRLVEKLSQSGPHPLETINSGVWAIGLANELAILLETGLQTDPDVVVLAWYLNDVQPSPGIQMIRPPKFAEHSWLVHYAYEGISVLRSKLVKEEYAKRDKETFTRWKEETARKFPPGDKISITTKSGFNRLIHNVFSDYGSAWSDGAWDYMRPYFIELQRQADLHDFELFIVAFPIRNQVAADFLYDYPQQKLKELAAELGIPVLDLLPRFREVYNSFKEAPPRSRRRMFYDWCHHTPYGNELIAEWVNDFLQEHLSS